MDRDMEINKKHKGGSDPQGFDKIVREIFAPIYPVIAQQILDKTDINNGRCLDVGCGTGALGRSIAQMSDLHITFFDQSPDMLELAQKYTQEENITNRSCFLEGDIHAMNIENESMDIVISRGSMPFWDDLHQACSEILRVLKVGGKAYIGGGFGSAELRDSIVGTMRENNPDWNKSFSSKTRSQREDIPQIVDSLKPSNFKIIDDDSGYWIYLTK